MTFKKCRGCQFIKSYFWVVVLMAFAVRFFPTFSSVFATILLIGIPLLLFKKTPSDLGFKNFSKGALYGILASLLILPLYSILCYHFGFKVPFALNLPVVSYLLSVAVSEEVFFRGFFYSVYENEELLKGLLTKNNLVSSFLFGVAHALIFYNPEMFKVFFPSLVMGWLYERSGSLLAPIIFHFFSDLTYQFVRCP
ncbi:CPBP family glutamic-type intramembrane protease [Thermovibrio sp.]